ncbi:MAG: DUF3276 family protein [Bacteroidota bacterium]
MDETGNHDQKDREEIYANVVRAGKRTYFFDVRATRGNDYYLTITESKRRYNEDGSYQYQKHKIFLYKEDFEKFGTALSETFKKIIELNKEQSEGLEARLSDQFTDVQFEDLGNQHEDQTTSEAESGNGDAHNTRFE